MKTFQNFYQQVFESLRFGRQVTGYALIFASAFFRNRASLGCELVAIQSQLTFYKVKHPPKETAPSTVYPGFPPPVGVLVSSVEWMGVYCAVNATKDRSEMA